MTVVAAVNVAEFVILLTTDQVVLMWAAYVNWPLFVLCWLSCFIVHILYITVYLSL